MEYLLRDGDYVSDGNGGFRRAEGNDALLQRVLWKLSVMRRSFPFLPELGSRLYLLAREKPGARLAAAKQYVGEALADEPGLTVTGLRLDEEDGGRLLLSVELERQDGTQTVSLEIGG